MSTPPTPRPAPRHPLEDDLARLERIVDVMWAAIHKVLDLPTPRRRRSVGSDVARGIGSDPLTGERTASAQRMSSLRLLPVLTPDAGDRVTTSWEGLAVGIARNKAKGALREPRLGCTKLSTVPS